MKKFFVLLTALTAFSLTGCNKVTYTEISEDKFAEYYTEDKINEAKQNFNLIYRFYFECEQLQKMSDFKMEYTLKRYFDQQYYHQYAKQYYFEKKASGDYESNGVSNELFLGNEYVEECNYYIVEDGTVNGAKKHEQECLIGQSALDEYDYYFDINRNIIYHSIENPLYIHESFISTNYKYYKGSDGTLKISATDAAGELKSYTIVNASTLLPIKAACKGTVEFEGDVVTLKLDYSFSYNKSFAHKTPAQIGYKEE